MSVGTLSYKPMGSPYKHGDRGRGAAARGVQRAVRVL
jgi:hypothetical protein